MTQIHNVNGVGRAYNMRQMMKRPRAQGASLLNRLNNFTTIYPCQVIEENGRAVPVTGKWFRWLMNDCLEDHSLHFREKTRHGVCRIAKANAVCSITRRQVNAIQRGQLDG